jgi:hypothetical protein
MANSKWRGPPPAKKERTLSDLLVLLDGARVRGEDQHKLVMGIMDKLFEGTPAPRGQTWPLPRFYGAYVDASGELVVYEFTWTRRGQETVPCWSARRYESHREPTLYRQLTGNEWKGEPMQQLTWEAEWERLVGFERAVQVAAFNAASDRENDLWGRYWVVVDAIKKVLVREAWTVTETAHAYERDVPSVRFDVDGRLISLVRNEKVVFGDPDVYRTLPGTTKIYDDPHNAVPSWRLQERARRGKK